MSNLKQDEDNNMCKDLEEDLTTLSLIRNAGVDRENSSANISQNYPSTARPAGKELMERARKQLAQLNLKERRPDPELKRILEAIAIDVTGMAPVYTLVRNSARQAVLSTQGSTAARSHTPSRHPLPPPFHCPSLVESCR